LSEKRTKPGGLNGNRGRGEKCGRIEECRIAKSPRPENREEASENSEMSWGSKSETRRKMSEEADGRKVERDVRLRVGVLGLRVFE
jgi:hypothetical protein